MRTERSSKPHALYPIAPAYRELPDRANLQGKGQPPEWGTVGVRAIRAKKKSRINTKKNVFRAGNRTRITSVTSLYTNRYTTQKYNP